MQQGQNSDRAAGAAFQFYGSDDHGASSRWQMIQIGYVLEVIKAVGHGVLMNGIII